MCRWKEHIQKEEKRKRGSASSQTFVLGVLHYVIQSVLFPTWIFFICMKPNTGLPMSFTVAYAAYLWWEHSLYSASIRNNWVIQRCVTVKPNVTHSCRGTTQQHARQSTKALFLFDHDAFVSWWDTWADKMQFWSASVSPRCDQLKSGENKPQNCSGRQPPFIMAHPDVPHYERAVKAYMQSKYYSLSCYSTSVMKWYVLLSYRFVCVKVMMFTFYITSHLCTCIHFCSSFSFIMN